MDVLNKFYVAYDAWIKGGAVGTEFTRYKGLCANLYDFAEGLGVDPERASKNIHNSFRFAGKDPVIPFDEAQPYCDESKRGECHLNTARLAWVAAQLKNSGGNDETSPY